MEELEIKKLLELIEQWTRAEIMARLGQLGGSSSTDFAFIKIEKENEIRKLLYGTDSLVKLGDKWNLLKDEQAQIKIQTKEDLKQQFQKLQRKLAALS